MAGKKRPAESRSRPNEVRPEKASSDYLLDAANQNWPHILMLYKQFEDKKAVTQFVGWECRGGRPVEYVVHPEVVHAESKAQATLLRDLCGNPFRPVCADPTWQMPEVISLAQATYRDHAFDRLPVLADALATAGCRDPDIISHCRVQEPHARGCWVLDLLLGKS